MRSDRGQEWAAKRKHNRDVVIPKRKAAAAKAAETRANKARAVSGKGLQERIVTNDLDRFTTILNGQKLDDTETDISIREIFTKMTNLAEGPERWNMELKLWHILKPVIHHKRYSPVAQATVTT